MTIVKLELDNTISPGGAEYHCSGRSPLGQRFYSSILDNGIDPVPTKMQPGEGLPFSGSVRITMENFAFGGRGTYFGRLIAANEYYLDKPLKIYTGFYDGQTFDWANFKEKLYFIKRIDGPDSNGRVTITADDILTLLDDDQAQITTAPDAKLVSNLSAITAGTINITDNTHFSATGGTCQINSEFIDYAGLSGSDSIVITGRARFGSSASAHNADDAVIPCYSYTNENVVSVIYSLIDLYSPIDASTYIPLSEWNDQRDSYLIGDNVTGVIPAGKKIKKKINQLCSQTSVSVWWDDEQQLVKLRAIGPTITPVLQIKSDENILNVGENNKRDPSKAVNTIIAYYGRKDFSTGEESPENYSRVYGSPDAESTLGFGKSKIETIYCSDIPVSGTSVVNKMIARRFSQRRKGINEYFFRLDVKAATISVGDEVQVLSDTLEDVDGNPTLLSYLITEKDQLSPTVYQYTAQATGFLTTGPYRVIAPNSMAGVTYASATQEQRLTYAFVADDVTQQFSNGNDPHLIL